MRGPALSEYALAALTLLLPTSGPLTPAPLPRERVFQLISAWPPLNVVWSCSTLRAVMLEEDSGENNPMRRVGGAGEGDCMRAADHSVIGLQRAGRGAAQVDIEQIRAEAEVGDRLDAAAGREGVFDDAGPRAQGHAVGRADEGQRRRIQPPAGVGGVILAEIDRRRLCLTREVDRVAGAGRRGDQLRRQPPVAVQVLLEARL